MSKELKIIDLGTSENKWNKLYFQTLNKCYTLEEIENKLKALEEIDDVLKDYNFERDDIINAIGLYRYFLDNKIDLGKVDDILTNNKEMLCYEKDETF